MTTIPEIIGLTAAALGHEPHELLSDTRGALLARHVAIYLSRQATREGLVEIGRHFNREHTSIHYVVTKVAEQIAADPRMEELVSGLSAEIEARRSLEAARAIDVLAVSARILANPARNAYRVSVDEIAALALAVRDFWDVAQTGEALAETAPGQKDPKLIAALSAAIVETMAELRGPLPDQTFEPPSEQKEAS